MVRLILHGELRQYAPGKVLEVHGDGRTAAEVLAAVGVPTGSAAAYVVNGEQCDPAVRLEDGDTVEVLPAISGGSERAERGSGFAGPSESRAEPLSGRRPRD